jgi:Protein of unknown function (DUF4238)
MSDAKKNSEFRHNHYVSEWYQKRFMLSGESKYWYLDMEPEVCKNKYATWKRKELNNWGAVSCFAQKDLYTRQWGTIENVDLERLFFGRIDVEGKKGVEYFASFEHPSANDEAFIAFLRYMSVQKLRTPKGLGYLKETARAKNQNLTLALLERAQHIFCAIWSEAVWQIADASRSSTKFIISDHPVTVYNRECFAGSEICKGHSDPDIRLAGTHTYFPLSLDKILILTNLTWVRDPYQNPQAIRPNPNLFRPAAPFYFPDIQICRFLNEDEVIEINYVTKRRALRYIAAADKVWLYPEKHLRNNHWRKLGDGYLFMPEPRHIHMGGQIYIGYEDGSSEAFGPYGHRPWQKGFEDEARKRKEALALERFKAEWAAMHGPAYRGINFAFASDQNPARTADSAEMHAHYLARDAEYRRLPGERQRRRRLMKNAGTANGEKCDLQAS